MGKRQTQLMFLWRVTWLPGQTTPGAKPKWHMPMSITGQMCFPRLRDKELHRFFGMKKCLGVCDIRFYDQSLQEEECRTALMERAEGMKVLQRASWLILQMCLVRFWSTLSLTRVSGTHNAWRGKAECFYPIKNITHKSLAHWVWCVLLFYSLQKFAVRDKTESITWVHLDRANPKRG